MTDAGDMVCYLVKQICNTSSSLMSHPVASQVRRGLPPHPAKLNQRDKTFKVSSQRARHGEEAEVDSSRQKDL